MKNTYFYKQQYQIIYQVLHEYSQILYSSLLILVMFKCIIYYLSVLY